MFSYISTENNKRKNDVQIGIFQNLFSHVTLVLAGCDAEVVGFGGLDDAGEVGCTI